VDSPLRLIASSPVDRLAHTVEALLVVASAPLSVAELAEATDDDPERVETALGLLGERYREGRSGIVLERVAGGYAFRASREAADACARLFERPVGPQYEDPFVELQFVVEHWMSSITTTGLLNAAICCLSSGGGEWLCRIIRRSGLPSRTPAVRPRL